MYRAIVLTTLVLLLLAVAGVSVAQEGGIFSVGGSNSDEPQGSTTPERTSLEATGSEDATTSPPPSASSAADDQQNISEPTVVTEPTVASEPTVGEPEKSTAAPAREQTPTPGTNDVGKPEHAGTASDLGRPRDEVGQHGNGGPVERGNEEGPGRGAGRQKVTLCHKGDKTLTVGAPALAAHLRHGDTRGACQGGVSGPGPPGEVMGPDAARNGEGGGGGQDKVVLCHKDKNTIIVGAAARAAHLRHGDSLGACR